MNKILLMFFSCVLIKASFASKISSWHFTPSEVSSLHSKSADYRILYGKESLQFADLRLPNGKGPFPVAIIIHGGCWTSTFADLKNTAALADALRDKGIATWNIEYRREDNIGGGWPGTFEDVANASDFLRKIASKYLLDLDHVIVIGQSAGGHLALWLASRHKLPLNSILYTRKPLALRGVIAMGGVPDLKAFRQQGKNVCNADVIGKLLGTTEENISRHYQDTSPINLLPLNIPQILIYGTDDTIVPASFGQYYTQQALKKADKAQLIEVKYADHHEYNVPNSVVWPILLDTCSNLLK